MKKVYGFLASLLAVGLVSGQTNAEVVGGGIAGFFTSILDAIQANPANLSTILFGVLIWMVLYSVVKEMDLFNGVAFAAPVVSIILTILSFIYVPQEIFNVAGANVGALGAIIITALPILIAFYFTVRVSNKSSMARIIWVGFALYYIVILVYTWTYAPAGTGLFDLGPQGAEGDTYNGLFYLIGFLISIAMIIFIPSLREWGFELEVEEKGEKKRRKIKLANEAIDTWGGEGLS